MSVSVMNALRGVNFKVGGVQLCGFSVSGLATWMIAPELNVCFDMGECPLSAIPMDHVFLTHAHGDHSRCLMRHHALRRMIGIEREATYYIPQAILEVTKSWIKASALFEGTKSRSIKLPDLIPLSTSQRDPMPLKHRKNLSVRSFHVHHGVPSLGYTLYDSRLKLKPQYLGLNSSEIVSLKRAGVEIQSPLHTPKLTFIGDCTADTLTQQEEIWKSRVLVIESTFIGEGEERFARKRGHTHLSEVGAVLAEGGDTIECEAIILKHFSMKVKPLEALEAALRMIPPQFHERVYLMTALPQGASGLSLAELIWRDLV